MFKQPKYALTISIILDIDQNYEKITGPIWINLKKYKIRYLLVNYYLFFYIKSEKTPEKTDSKTFELYNYFY